jgi:Putative peptidoglycan binding domain
MSTPDDDALTIDTTPPDADPEAAQAEAAPEAEGVHPDSGDDEPWSDVDPEAFDDPDAAPPASFGGPIPLRDTSTRERWLQSALQALVAPKLVVDGELGPRTSEAVATFQRRAAALGVGPLAVDGDPGPRTIKALERATLTKAPVAAAPGAARDPCPRRHHRAGAPRGGGQGRHHARHHGR